MLSSRLYQILFVLALQPDRELTTNAAGSASAKLWRLCGEHGGESLRPESAGVYLIRALHYGWVQYQSHGIGSALNHIQLTPSGLSTLQADPRFALYELIQAGEVVIPDGQKFVSKPMLELDLRILQVLAGCPDGQLASYLQGREGDALPLLLDLLGSYRRSVVSRRLAELAKRDYVQKLPEVRGARLSLVRITSEGEKALRADPRFWLWQYQAQPVS